jgi:hypothetical protein
MQVIHDICEADEGLSELAVAARYRHASRASPASILFRENVDRRQIDATSQPAYFVDLNLDQIVAGITGPKAGYNLAPFFHACLTDHESVKFRQDVMRDLHYAPLFGQVEAFASSMRLMRQHLERAEKSYHPLQKQRWNLEAVLVYCGAARCFARELDGGSLQSEGFKDFRADLAACVASAPFDTLSRNAEGLKAKLGSVRYGLIVRGGSVTVRRYDGETDHGALVERTFEKFRQGAAETYVDKPLDYANLNHVEEKVLEFVAKLNPDIFAELESFCRLNRAYVDPLLQNFDREVQFYIAYLDYIQPLTRAGLSFTFPEIASADKAVHARDSFDLALATKLLKAGSAVVRNDFELGGPERILIVSGPNQGGKTTLARMFGQLHHLTCLGCLVPGSDARLFLFDQMFTHFERGESLATLRGKLQDDLVRIHDYLERATSDSILIMNEIFTSTTLLDATVLSERIMRSVVEKDLLSVWVTFIGELASFGPQTVSMASTVVPGNPAERTFKVVRKPSDGIAYALSIAEKYRLTYDRLRERLI